MNTPRIMAHAVASFTLTAEAERTCSSNTPAVFRNRENMSCSTILSSGSFADGTAKYQYALAPQSALCFGTRCQRSLFRVPTYIKCESVLCALGSSCSAQIVGRITRLDCAKQPTSRVSQRGTSTASCTRESRHWKTWRKYWAWSLSRVN